MFEKIKIMKLIYIIILALFGKGVNKLVATTGGIMIFNCIKSQTTIVSRPVDSSTFQISTSYDAIVYYSIRINCTASIGAAASGTVSLQYTTDAWGTWSEASVICNSTAVSLAPILSTNDNKILIISAVIPANLEARLVQTTSGSCTITFITGQETIQN